MNKKTTILSVLVLLLVLAGGFWYLYNNFYKSNTQSPTKQTADFSNQITGQVTVLTDSSITVSGIVTSSKDSRHTENKTIEFAITNQTRFIKTVMSPPSGAKPGQVYNPELTEIPGMLSDLKEHSQIRSLQSKENLFTVNKATAVEINYVIFELKK